MCLLLACEKIKRFLAVHRVNVVTLRECRLHHTFPDQVIRCWVRTRPPPPAVWA
jgi:hypothetical protein